MVLQNTDLDTEEFTTGFTQIGTYSIDDPQYDSTGALTGTTTRDIPRFKSTFALKPTMKAIWDQEQQIKDRFNTFVLSQTLDMTTRFSSGFSLSGLSAKGVAPPSPIISNTLTDYATERERVRQAMLDRIEYQFSLDLEMLEAKLANQGISAGMTAYDREMFTFAKRHTDARLQVDLSAGQEASRMIRDTVIILEFGNSANIKLYQALRDLADFANNMRERSLQELIAERSQVINELSTLQHGGQIVMPQMRDTKGGQIAGTDMIGAVMQSAALDQRNYQSRVAQQQAMIGGIAQIGGSLLSAPMTGGTSVAGNLLGKLG